MTPRRSRTSLRLYLAGAYTLLVIYASLYPMSAWHDSGTFPLDFLTAPWPRYTTLFDISTNIFAYFPFGFLWFAAFKRQLPNSPSSTRLAWLAWFLASLLGGMLSFSMEFIQTYLPSRVPSNLDLVSNSVGALLGASAGLRWAALLDATHLNRWRDELVLRAEGTEFGLLLLGGWLLTQLSPESLVFGSGNLRQMLGLPPAQPFLAERFIDIEAAIASAGFLAAALIATLIFRLPNLQRRFILCAALLTLAVALKALAYALLMGPVDAFLWITPGNSAGIAAGLLVWGVATLLSARVQQAIAALALLLATVMVNLAPENPYLANTLQIWNPGHFLNFNGLTRLVCSLWPFLALTWLMLYRPERSH